MPVKPWKSFSRARREASEPLEKEIKNKIDAVVARHRPELDRVLEKATELGREYEERIAQIKNSGVSAQMG